MFGLTGRGRQPATFAVSRGLAVLLPSLGTLLVSLVYRGGPSGEWWAAGADPLSGALLLAFLLAATAAALARDER